MTFGKKEAEYNSSVKMKVVSKVYQNSIIVDLCSALTL